MNEPLVSIVVITYNSSAFIIEGLDSVKDQIYKNIELIISDDCSTDNTVALCRSWLDANKSYFKRSQLITTDRNSGVAGNLNRGVRAARGEWIKTLSGDDKLLPYSIEKYVEYAADHHEADIIFGKLNFYGPDGEYVLRIKEWYENNYYPKIGLSQKEQFIENLKSLFVPGPGLFYKRALWEEVDGYDERYPFCEEDPFMFKIFKSGRKIYLLDEEVYGYQMHIDSLGREQDLRKTWVTRHLEHRIRFFMDNRRREMFRQSLFHPELALIAFNDTLNFEYILSKAYNKKFRSRLFRVLKIFSPLTYKIFYNRLRGSGIIPWRG